MPLQNPAQPVEYGFEIRFHIKFFPGIFVPSYLRRFALKLERFLATQGQKKRRKSQNLWITQLGAVRV